jgi:hypothetical protein
MNENEGNDRMLDRRIGGFSASEFFYEAYNKSAL